MKEILTENKKGLKLFSDGVRIDENLPKWKNAKQVKTENGTTYYTVASQMSSPTTSTPEESGWSFRTIGVEYPKENNILQFDDVVKMGLLELNKFIQEKNISYYLTKTGRYESDSVTFGYNQGPNLDEWYKKKKEEEKNKTFWARLKKLFEKREYEVSVEPIPEFDVVEFFTKVKATSKESAQDYVFRVSKYIKAITNARLIGQEALVEQLIREMIVNKYESFLVAEGYYHVVKEAQVVDFIRRSEKGIAIDYIKNFVRPIPMNVAEAIAKASALEVFDNYVIMHYDPDGESSRDTAKEEDKRRDPIVFGVIAGSNKLYYITDWIDDYCDLTLEKFVDTLGIEKADLIEDEIIKGKVDAEKKENSERANKEAPKKTSKKAKKDNAKAVKELIDWDKGTVSSTKKPATKKKKNTTSKNK